METTYRAISSTSSLLRTAYIRLNQVVMVLTLLLLTQHQVDGNYGNLCRSASYTLSSGQYQWRTTDMDIPSNLLCPGSRCTQVSSVGGEAYLTLDLGSVQ